jgi:methylenetetrahydrofolate reductase (NADPH)
MSKLSEILDAGKFSVTAEIGPPIGSDAEFVREKARALKGFAHAANITDNQTAIVRMSSVAASVLSESEGVEAVMQMTCRDRNRIAMQSDLLGATALGIKNLLCLSGDHQTFGNHPESKNVYDLDSIQLIAAVGALNNGTLLNGKPLKGKTDFFIGASANPFADPEELQLIRLKKKIDAGARFIQTQAIYDVERFARWMERVREMGLHKRAYMLAGVLVNKSVKSIEMTGLVAGMSIPGKLVERMKAAPDASAEGLNIATELIAELRGIEGVAGIHIMAVGWESIVPTLIEKADLKQYVNE